MKKQKQTNILTLGVRPEFIQLILYMSKVLGELPSRKPGSLWLLGGAEITSYYHHQR